MHLSTFGVNEAKMARPPTLMPNRTHSVSAAELAEPAIDPITAHAPSNDVWIAAMPIWDSSAMLIDVHPTPAEAECRLCTTGSSRWATPRGRTNGIKRASSVTASAVVRRTARQKCGDKQGHRNDQVSHRIAAPGGDLASRRDHEPGKGEQRHTGERTQHRAPQGQ
jgi:hypothetical protein